MVENIENSDIQDDSNFPAERKDLEKIFKNYRRDRDQFRNKVINIKKDGLIHKYRKIIQKQIKEHKDIFTQYFKSNKKTLLAFDI